VPVDKLGILADVIKGREVCAAWYAAQPVKPGGKLEEERVSHAYFIKVLREAYDLLGQVDPRRILRPAERARCKKQQEAEKMGQGDKLTNLFAHLQVDEPSEQTLDSSTAVSTTHHPASCQQPERVETVS